MSFAPPAVPVQPLAAGWPDDRLLTSDSGPPARW
jgi:hypothetical protein